MSYPKCLLTARQIIGNHHRDCDMRGSLYVQFQAGLMFLLLIISDNSGRFDRRIRRDLSCAQKLYRSYSSANRRTSRDFLKQRAARSASNF